MQGAFLQAIFPRIFGHEASGIVESVGQGVTEFKEEDHVLIVFIGECMSCRQCTSGKSNTCEILGLERRGLIHSDQKTRFSLKGKLVYNYCAVSSFSEYTVVHSGCVVKVSPLAPLEKICLLSCGVVAELGPYIKELSKAGGAIQEFVNPKYKMPAKLHLSPQLDLNMMEMWLAYAPVKNNAEDAAKVQHKF
ncbi:alcohol dehydrogenase-like 6 [Glycine soja]|uniref:alcohol dehydrogenase-like 6 n=1 Tax=Glycine soja TaxID=3848 RepID=UPI0010389370|nr:alcohol dehydrogenase-like 6 [Glycine soja]